MRKTARRLLKSPLKRVSSKFGLNSYLILRIKVKIIPVIIPRYDSSQIVLAYLISSFKANRMRGEIQIQIEGHLDKQWKEVFHGMSISYDKDVTILTASLKDDAQLHGVLNTIRDLNLKLISLKPIS